MKNKFKYMEIIYLKCVMIERIIKYIIKINIFTKLFFSFETVRYLNIIFMNLYLFNLLLLI